MNKSGKGMAIIAVALIALVAIGAYAVFKPQLGQVTGDGGAGDTGVVESSSVKFKAKDVLNASQTQVGTSLYSWRTSNGEHVSVDSGTSTSATADTTTLMPINAQAGAVCFDSTFYGDKESFTVKTDPYNVKLDVYDIGTATRYFDDSGDGITEITSDTSANITMGASQTECFSIILEETDTRSQYRFKGVGFNMSSASNIVDITVKQAVKDGVVTSMREGTIPERLRTQLDWYYELPNYITLNQNDELEIQQVCFEASGSNPAEDFFMIFLDESWYESVQPATSGQILSGVETDADTPADVGAGDLVSKGKVH